ncbi:hypothetical protein F53441_4724 [Fusarium austroafricanum]|uniref:Mid2 domain-containing protein n=1 Tax=Fusarium austroafricanum TaxID=2364996 RepID=A0A8H4NV86_9HYPO|nr:hypothetical protein F53441_4724 [Fusarium austroafricanum]
MLALLSAYLAAIIFVSCGRCDSEFITPSLSTSNWTENLVYAIDDKLNVKWKTDTDSCNLLLWQDYPKLRTEYFYQVLEDTNETSYTWNVSLSGVSEESEDSVFHFALYSSRLDIPLANSGNFNISSTKREKLKDNSSSKPTPTSKNSSSPETTHHSTGDLAKESGLSTAALVGISVGVTVAGLLISGAIGLCLWRRFTHNRTTSRVESIEKADFMKAELGGTQVLQTGTSELDSAKETAELSDTQKLGELGEKNKIRVVYGLHEAP